MDTVLLTGVSCNIDRSIDQNIAVKNQEGVRQEEILVEEDQDIDSPNILNLSNQNLEQVSQSVFQKINLEGLNLSNNKLTGLPYELGNLKNIKVIYLSGNDISKQDLDIIRKSLSMQVEIKL